jgi:hypothetical protein
MHFRVAGWSFVLLALVVAVSAGPAWATTIVPGGVDDAWHNHPVEVTFQDGVAPVVTQFRLGAEAYWRQGESLTISDEGITSLTYLSSHEAGAVLPVTDATFASEVLWYPRLVVTEFWDPG